MSKLGLKRKIKQFKTMVQKHEMNLTKTQKIQYTNSAPAKSGVGIGLPVSNGVNNTPKTICVFFIAKNSVISTPVNGVSMMGCVGVSQDTLFPFDSKTNPTQLITSFDWSLIGDENSHYQTEQSIMTNISSTATLVAIKNISFENIQVSFTHDAYLNATAIAKQFGKRVQNYLKSEQTQEYIIALAEALFGASKQNQLVIIKKGGNGTQGTWLHPKLAIDFARWLNPKFAVWCDMQIEKILKGEYAQPSSTQNQELYQLCSGSLNYLMDYVKTLHNLNTVAHSDVLHNQKNFVVQQIHAIIQYCYANNITTPTGKPIFKNGELNFIGGNSVVYNLPMLRLAGLVNY